MGRFMVPCCCVCGKSSTKWHDEKWETDGGLQDFCPEHRKQLNELQEYGNMIETNNYRNVPSDGDCIDCGKIAVTFEVTPELWEKATGLSQNGGVLCPYCFEKRALDRGIRLGNWTVNQKRANKQRKVVMKDRFIKSALIIYTDKNLKRVGMDRVIFEDMNKVYDFAKSKLEIHKTADGFSVENVKELFNADLILL